MPACTLETVGFSYHLPGAATYGGDREYFPMNEIHGFIFDLDGVLVDTAEYHYLAWKRLADEEGLPFDRQANEAIRGIPRRGSLLKILNGRPVNEAQLQEMMERKNRYYLESVWKLTPKDMLPGAANLLQEIRQAGMRVAIASSSKNAGLVVERLKLGQLIDVLADGNSVSSPKPAPDLFEYASGQLGLLPRECVVVEDAEAGIQAARAGGFCCIGLGPYKRVGEADLVLPSLENVHFEQILAEMQCVGMETGLTALAAF
jgi:beta-phosphoglucomutase